MQTKSNKGAGHAHLEQYSQKQVAKKALKLLPSLCDHLEATSAYFQALIEQNDGLMDGPGSNTEEAQLMGRCLELLLQAMCSLFSWLVFVKNVVLKEFFLHICQLSRFWIIQIFNFQNRKNSGVLISDFV